jgi:GNAT superfamily N-acetyltransferase
MRARRATRNELDGVTQTITLAFATDPIWSVALARSDGRVDHHRDYWRMFVDGAAAQDGIWLIDDGAAVAVWIPPDGRELSDAATAELERYNVTHLGETGAREMAELYERFDANHPTTERHAYLSLLATHPDHRGKGIGQALLTETLGWWDAAGVPAYLESTNPANDHRYERAGFRPVGEFHAVRDDAPITTMWRPIGGARLPAPDAPG